MKYVLIGIGACVGLFVLACAIVLWAIGSIMCGNEVKSRVLSPDGRWAAVMFERNCGATTSFGYMVSIIPSVRSDPEIGNTLAADQTPRVRDIPDPKWTAIRSLTIYLPHGARIFRQEQNVEGVHVTYEEIGE